MDLETRATPDDEGEGEGEGGHDGGPGELHDERFAFGDLAEDFSRRLNRSRGERFRDNASGDGAQNNLNNAVRNKSNGIVVSHAVSRKRKPTPSLRIHL